MEFLVIGIFLAALLLIIIAVIMLPIPEKRYKSGRGYKPPRPKTLPKPTLTACSCIYCRRQRDQSKGKL